MSNDDNAAVPFSIRLPGKLVSKLYLYGEQMEIGPSKLLASILEDVFPAFERDKDFTVTVKKAAGYAALKSVDGLRSVNLNDLEQKLLKRLDPGGPMGRPRKPRKI